MLPLFEQQQQNDEETVQHQLFILFLQLFAVLTCAITILRQRLQVYSPQFMPLQWGYINSILTLWCACVILAAIHLPVVSTRHHSHPVSSSFENTTTTTTTTSMIPSHRQRNEAAQAMYIVWNLISTTFWVIETGLTCCVLEEEEEENDKDEQHETILHFLYHWICSNSTLVWIDRTMLLIASYFLIDADHMLRAWKVRHETDIQLKWEYGEIVLNLVVYAGATAWNIKRYREQQAELELQGNGSNSRWRMGPNGGWYRNL